MNKLYKMKSLAYSVNAFVLGLTGGSLLPSKSHQALALVSLALLIMMAGCDFVGKLIAPKTTGVVKKVKGTRRKPPKKGGRRK